MSTHAAPLAPQPPEKPAKGAAPAAAPRSAHTRTPFHAHGEPKLWLTGGGLVICIGMIVGLLALVIVQGLHTFWPVEVVEVKTYDGRAYLGEIYRTESYEPTAENIEELPAEVRDQARATLAKSGGSVRRRYIRTGRLGPTDPQFVWVSDLQLQEESRPEWALVIERMELGVLYAFPAAFLEREAQAEGAAEADADSWKLIAEDPPAVWQKFEELHDSVRQRRRQRVRLEKDDLGAVSGKENQARIQVSEAKLSYGSASTEYDRAEQNYLEVQTWAEHESSRIKREIDRLNKENERYKLRLRIADGKEYDILLADIVRACPANRLGFGKKTGVYLSRWKEFLTDDPREANTAGGVFPAIWGTVAMTLLMTIAVVPLGVLAALYLREYAKFRPAISAVRIAINNLAGVPSIVFGIFGLGFFAYIVGGMIDSHFYRAEMIESPVFGGPGLLWASLTMALLTLPVVIVTTEEALAAVPNSLREGSYACGASKWQTILRIVLPRAMPGILTGTILAIARGAGEVAPLLLTGVAKLAPKLPVDSEFPFLHPSRRFMHLGFHIYDLSGQTTDIEAAIPMIFTTTLLLITIIAALNLTAVVVRARLRRRHMGAKFQ